MEELQLIHRLIDIIHYKDIYQQQTSGVQPQDMFVLERIYFHDKKNTCQARDLVNRYAIPPSTMTGVIDRLEKKGLVNRDRSQKDRRAVSLSVTEKGEMVIKRHIGEDQVFVKQFFAGLDPDQEITFKKLLTKLLNNLNRDDIFR